MTRRNTTSSQKTKGTTRLQAYSLVIRQPKTKMATSPNHDLPYPLFAASDKQGRGPSKAPLVQTVKIGASRYSGGAYPWRSFDMQYNKAIVAWIKDFQYHHGIPATGNYGEATHELMLKLRVPKGYPHAGELIFNSVALNILENEFQRLHPQKNALERVHDMISQLGYAIIENAANIGYTQRRAMNYLFLLKPEDVKWDGDCSGTGTGLCSWTRLRTGIMVPDPNGRHYDGYGFTGTLVANSTAMGKDPKRVEVGDFAMYGPDRWNTKHVIICIKAGKADTAEYVSHGRQEGPEHRDRARYRYDYLGIWRPRLTP